ncbi:MAG: ABC transporter permease [Chloroflexi bacterium]|nr:MAG: ABC transporter permease [Chloroflexota bacterium]
MDLFKSYILPRLLQWAIVIFVGVTVTFIIPRLLPSDPVQQTLTRVASMSFVDPAALESYRATIEDLYGLRGTPLEQYLAFWRRMLRGDLGPSLSAFPTPVISIIKTGLPWTIGLLTTTIILSWLLGIALGTFAGYFPRNRVAQVYDKVLITVYPIPYYVLALILVMLFAYYWPIFPLVGGYSGVQSFSWRYISSIIEHAVLPATSLILGATAFRYIMARALTKTLVTSDFITYAETATLPRRTILGYITRNSMLPQITDLGLSLGAMFEGALVTEVVFGYPGIGYALYTAILQADFNMILGITLFSVVGIATAALIIDLAYPLFDPRVRYR